MKRKLLDAIPMRAGADTPPGDRKRLRAHFSAIGMDRVFNFNLDEVRAQERPWEWLFWAWRYVLHHGADASKLSVITTAVQAICMMGAEEALYRALCGVICDFYLSFPDARLVSTVSVVRLAYDHSMPEIKDALVGLAAANRAGFGCGTRFRPGVLRELIYRHILPHLLRDSGANAEKRIRAVCNTANYLDRFWIRNLIMGAADDKLVFNVCGRTMDARRHAYVGNVPPLLLSHTQRIVEATAADK